MRCSISKSFSRFSRASGSPGTRTMNLEKLFELGDHALLAGDGDAREDTLNFHDRIDRADALLDLEELLEVLARERIAGHAHDDVVRRDLVRDEFVVDDLHRLPRRVL